MHFIEIPSIHSLVIIKNDDTKVLYVLLENKERVNEQQFNLKEGQILRYEDGAKIIHCGDYCLLRNWKLDDGRLVDKVALRWNNLHL